MSQKSAKINNQTDDGKSDKNKVTAKDVFEQGSRVIHMSLVPYWLLALIRIILTVIPQTGYIHPDEYFQSFEIVNGDLFNFASNRPWEFKSNAPVRSATVPFIFVGVPLLMLKHSASFIYDWFGINIISPYFQLIFPRLLMCTLSFLTDFSLYRICYKYAQNYRTQLTVLASSYVMLVYGTRTFSNTIELFLSSLLIFLVADSMARSDRILYKEEYYKHRYNAADDLKEKVKYHRLRLALPWHMFSSVFAISTVVVLGVFNRPTFIAYAFPPLFFWLQRGLGSSSVTFTDFHMRTLVLILASLPSFASIVTCDSLYFGFLTVEQLFARQFSLVENFVVTPYNFIMYNVNSSNLAAHGLHSRLTHTLVNIPLLFNVLGVIGILAFLNIIYRLLFRKWSSLPRVQSIVLMMTCSYIIPIVALSVFPHQEPRFLLPCILPLVFMHSPRLRSPRYLLTLWYFLNIVLTAYYGFIQQAGIFPLITHMQKEVEAKPRLTAIHLVSSHIYPLPISFLQLKYGNVYTTATGTRYQRARDFFTYEMGSSHRMKTALTKLKTVQSICESTYKEKRIKYRLYMVLPTSLLDEFHMEAIDANVTYSVDTVFYPHLSVEAMPSPVWENPIGYCDRSEFSATCDANSRNPVEYLTKQPVAWLTSLAKQLGLALIHIPRPV